MPTGTAYGNLPFFGHLFFANIDTFQNDIENAIKEDTKQVIVDASGIGSLISQPQTALLF